MSAQCSGTNGTSVSHSLPPTQGISQKGRHKVSRIIQWGELELNNVLFCFVFICMFPKRLTWSVAGIHPQVYGQW